MINFKKIWKSFLKVIFIKKKSNHDYERKKLIVKRFYDDMPTIKMNSAPENCWNTGELRTDNNLNFDQFIDKIIEKPEKD